MAQAERDDVKSIPLPIAYYMGAHGDPIAVLGKGTGDEPWLLLDLHPDGSVTWRQVLKTRAGDSRD